jgi:polyhydroxyalkanoate synthesis regulator phasin
MVARGSERIADVLEELLVELPARLRGGKTRFSEQAVGMVRALVDELDLATRDEVDELELRVAQLEHRLRLLEEQPELPGPA